MADAQLTSAVGASAGRVGEGVRRVPPVLGPRPGVEPGGRALHRAPLVMAMAMGGTLRRVGRRVVPPSRRGDARRASAPGSRGAGAGVPDPPPSAVRLRRYALGRRRGDASSSEELDRSTLAVEEPEPRESVDLVRARARRPPLTARTRCRASRASVPQGILAAIYRACSSHTCSSRSPLLPRLTSFASWAGGGVAGGGSCTQADAKCARAAGRPRPSPRSSGGCPRDVAAEPSTERPRLARPVPGGPPLPGVLRTVSAGPPIEDSAARSPIARIGRPRAGQLVVLAHRIRAPSGRGASSGRAGRHSPAAPTSRRCPVGSAACSEFEVSGGQGQVMFTATALGR
jgi:hypothetical protein